MSDPNPGAAAPAAPANLVPVPATPAPVLAVPPAAPAPAPQVRVTDLPDDALKLRLEQAERAGQKKLLDALGITDPEQAKAAIAAQKAAEDAKKTAETRIAEQTLTIEQQNEALTVAIAQATERITPEQKAAVDAIAGVNRALWLKTYAALAPTWQSPAPAAPTQNPAPAATAPAAPTPTPPGTAPAAPAPAPGAPQISPADHPAVYTSLKKTNPFAAAAYLKEHGDACFTQS